MAKIFFERLYMETDESNTIVTAGGMLVLLLSNIILLQLGVAENHSKSFSFAQSFIFAILSVILISIQAIFSSIQWNSMYYKTVAELAFWLIIIDAVVMIVSLMGLI